MSWRDGCRHRLRSLLHVGKVRREREEELAFHLRQESEVLRRTGLSEEAARQTALARLYSDPRPGRPRSGLAADLRLAVQSLRRTPGYTLGVVLTLGVAFIIVTVTASVVSALFLRPLPYPDDEQLVVLSQTNAQQPRGFKVSLPNFRDWSARTRSMHNMAAWHPLTVTLSAPGAEPRRIAMTTVTGEFFATLGVQAALGRVLSVADEAGDGRLMVLSDRLWRDMFGADAGIVGRVVRVDDGPVHVVGVMPAAFRYPSTGEAWRPNPLGRQQYMPRNSVNDHVVARLTPTSTLADAQAELSSVAEALQREFPNPAVNQATGARVITLRDDLLGEERPVLLLLTGAVGIAFVVACLNVVCVNLARAARRRLDFAVRMALGAGRRRIMQYWLLEALCCTALAAAVAWVMSPGLLRLIWSLDEFALLQAVYPVVDWWSYGATGLLAVGVALAMSVWPAAVLSRDAEAGLRAGEARAIGSGARLRAWLVGVEVSVATVLLVGAALAMQSVMTLLNQQMGFDASSVTTADLQIPLRGGAQTADVMDRVHERLSAIPGVEAVGSISTLPLSAESGRPPRIASGLRVAGAPDGPAHSDGAGFHAVSGDYFRAMGIPLIRGRVFAAEDGSGAPRAAVISRAMAERYWPGGDAIGSTFEVFGADPRLAGQPLTVIGIVGDVRSTSLERAALPDYYVSYRQGIAAQWRRTVVVRGAGNSTVMLREVRTGIRDVMPEAALSVATMEGRVRRSLARRLFARTALTSLCIAGVALVVVGVYGVLASTVTARRREIGLRIALGASPWRVRSAVMQAVLRPVVVGLVTGLSVAWWMDWVMQHLAFSLSPRDPRVFVVALVVIAGASVAAAIIPVIRATRVNPSETLRAS